MLAIPILVAAIQPPMFEELDLIDARIAEIGTAAPVDRRLKLARCPAPADIAPAGGSAIAVRCPALGWRILVPLTAPAHAFSPDVRKGDIVDLTVEGAGFSISTAATAVEDGRIGQTMQVRTGDKTAPISTAVLGAGRVVVPAAN